MKIVQTPLLLLIMFTMIMYPVSGKSITNSDYSIENEASNDVKKFMEGFKNGNFVIGTTTASGIKAIVGPYVTETESMVTYKRSFTGYSFAAEWSLTEGKLAYFTINTFYDEDKRYMASQDGNEIKSLLDNIFGTAVASESTYSDWEYGDLSISFDLFEDGYSIYVDLLAGGDDDYDFLCVGDFENLKNDLQSVFIDNIKSGAIKIGKTTKDEMTSLTGSGELYDKDYDGLWVAGTFLYDDNGYLSSLSLDYFYDCSGALILLDVDKGDLTQAINDALGIQGSKSSDNVDATVSWNVKGQKLSQEGYEDGYAVLLNP